MQITSFLKDTDQKREEPEHIQESLFDTELVDLDNLDMIWSNDDLEIIDDVANAH